MRQTDASADLYRLIAGSRALGLDEGNVLNSSESTSASAIKDEGLSPSDTRAAGSSTTSGSANGVSFAPLEAVLAPTTPPTPPEATPSTRDEIVSFIKTVALFLVLALFLRASVVEAFKIPSASMVPTLRIGDHILVSKLSYGIRLPLLSKAVYQFAEPRRGDIVVFTRDDDPDTNIIKRVAAIPGDLVEVRNTKLLINNQLQYEPYARYELNGIKNFGPERVPAGHVFMLGDNRDHSRDSRFWDDTPWLSIENVKGRALIIYWSFDPSWRDRLGKLIR